MSKEENKLRHRWGKDIPFFDELDVNYIPLNQDYLPIPIITDDKTHRQHMKRLEKILTNPNGVSRSIKVSLTPQYTTKYRKNRIPIPQYIKDMVLEERGQTCEYCRNNRFDEWHHINNNPSDNRPENLAIICYRCHKNTHMKRGNATI